MHRYFWDFYNGLFCYSVKWWTQKEHRHCEQECYEKKLSSFTTIDIQFPKVLFCFVHIEGSKRECLDFVRLLEIVIWNFIGTCPYLAKFIDANRMISLKEGYFSIHFSLCIVVIEKSEINQQQSIFLYVRSSWKSTYPEIKSCSDVGYRSGLKVWILRNSFSSLPATHPFE